jgi:hypothetical protein
MKVGWRAGTVAGITAVVVLATPSVAHAGLAITVPSTVNLGSVASGTSSLSHQLGTVMVTASVTPLSWTATVSSSDFTTGAPVQTIGKGSISYWSGPVTGSSGVATRTPGQVTSLLAVSLSVARTAFSAVSVVGSSTSWNPTIVIAISAAAVAGTYSGTITHSVA